jgi:hypothetical protein
LWQTTVAGNDIPVTIQRERRVGFLRFQHEVDGFPCPVQDGVMQRTLWKNRGIPGSHQEYIALALGHLELLGEVQNHFTAGDGTPSFKEAEVPRGDVSFASQVELTEAAAQSPVAKQIADGLYRGHAI